MVKKLKESCIPEDYSKALSITNIKVGTEHVDKIFVVTFDAITTLLAQIKSQDVPKAVVFRSVDVSFLAAAKVEYINEVEDSTENHWNYLWTVDDADLEGVEIIDFVSNGLLIPYVTSTAMNLYNLKFNNQEVLVTMCTLCIESIIKWLRDNTKEGEECTLELDDVFSATGDVVDGNVEIAIVPEGRLKLIIKDDSGLQN